jgi:hypothetical protein
VTGTIPTVETTHRLVGHIGRVLLLSALVCWAGALWATTRSEQWFYDNLDNEAVVARDSVVVLVVLGLVLALNGTGLLWWIYRETTQEARRMRGARR